MCTHSPALVLVRVQCAQLHVFSTAKCTHTAPRSCPCASAAHSCMSSQQRNAHTQVLALALMQCPHLKEVDLSSNGLHYPDCMRVCAALMRCPALVSLDLSCNLLRHHCAHDIANLLAQCTQLENLNLSDNCLGDAGAVMLASVLASCRHLATLRLAHNCIYQRGALGLARGVRLSPALRRLDLAHNHIDRAGTQALLCAALYSRCGLQRMNLEGNHTPEFLGGG